MAVKLKIGETFIDPRDSTKNVDGAYGVITQININHNFKTGQLTKEVYPRKCTREERASSDIKPIHQHTETINPKLYNKYFDKSKYINGYNEQKASYNLFTDTEIEETEITVDEEGKEVITTMTVDKYAKWESDE